MNNDEVLAIADPKDRELVRFSVGETLDANVKVLQAVVPRFQSTGPRDTYIVRRVCQGPPFARWRRGVRAGGPLPPTWDPPAVVVGDEEGNTFLGEWYCRQVTGRQKEHQKEGGTLCNVPGVGEGGQPETFFFGDFLTSRPSRSRRTENSGVCPHGQTRRWSGTCPASSSCPLRTLLAGPCANCFGTKGTWGT